MSYKHFDADKTRLASPAQPTDEATNEKPSLLKDVSITQILATSLAAVTAFVLSNQIGIAGSRTLSGAPRISSALATTMNITSRHIQTAAKQRLKAHNICLEHNMHLLAIIIPTLTLVQGSRRR